MEAALRQASAKFGLNKIIIFNLYNFFTFLYNPFRYVVIMRENSLRVAEVEVVAEAAMEYKSEGFSKIYLTMDFKKMYPWKNITVTNPPLANCLELHAAGYRQDGVYWIDPTGQRVLTDNIPK